jgi:plasmid stabilization system protein ParE
LDDALDIYRVTISDYALRDLEAIYSYIADTLLEPGIALNLVDDIESGILSLDVMPHRCPERRVGAYANRGYRQLFVGNYTAVFRIDEENKQVIVLTVKYSPSQF